MVTHYAYWISTALLALLYLSSATLYVVKKDWVRQALADLNYAAPYLVPLMVVVKVLGPLAILSRVSVPLSDLAYAGTFFQLLLSASAHLGVRKPKGALAAVLGLVLLVVSFTTQNIARDTASPYGAVVATQQSNP
ncbi:DoxX family protein [Pseudomonas citri]|uniref:DoxX family protein n=1 Tax=Pseudomonas citri TaxID=2978349 RepID=UPI0021B672F1|nr:DoxX family protein [Pseudomonas citri]